MNQRSAGVLPTKIQVIGAKICEQFWTFRHLHEEENADLMTLFKISLNSVNLSDVTDESRGLGSFCGKNSSADKIPRSSLKTRVCVSTCRLSFHG